MACGAASLRCEKRQTFRTVWWKSEHLYHAVTRSSTRYSSKLTNATQRLLQQIIPADENDVSFASDDRGPNIHEAPPFNLTTMSYNFRRFNGRIGVVFEFQEKVIWLLSWQQPTHTFSFLAVYTFVCLDPYLIFVLPLVLLLLNVLIPSFMTRHPAPPKGTLSSEQGVGYSAGGPPLAPPLTVKPAKDMSKDFFHNMRDLQNSMGDFCLAHDAIVDNLLPLTNFSDEALSSTVFMSLCIATIGMSIAAHVIPWRFVFLLGGWAAIGSSHPIVARQIEATRKSQEQNMNVGGEKAKSLLDNWIASDIILDSAPETREVEIFELQRKSGAGEWEPWVFCPTPYDPLSASRIGGERPGGTRFFEDVLPPDGWDWSEKKWALDLLSRDWVEERIITGVEVETEGERWVYDIFDEQVDDRTGVVDEPNMDVFRTRRHTSSWEEGEDSSGPKGEWRRRRWVRLVKRRIVPMDFAL